MFGQAFAMKSARNSTGLRIFSARRNVFDLCREYYPHGALCAAAVTLV
jgi:hypothetical protein